MNSEIKEFDAETRKSIINFITHAKTIATRDAYGNPYYDITHTNGARISVGFERGNIVIDRYPHFDTIGTTRTQTYAPTDAKEIDGLTKILDENITRTHRIKTDKYDLLADVVRALRDINTEVKVETLRSKHIGGIAFVSSDGPQTPVRGDVVSNKMFAKSITFPGNGISITRDKGEYVLHTPNGEARFAENDVDARAVWGQALVWYQYTQEYGKEHAFKHVSQYLPYNLRNPKLLALAKQSGNRDKSTKSEFEKAVEKLKALGVEPNEEIMAKYAAMQNQND